MKSCDEKTLLFNEKSTNNWIGTVNPEASAQQAPLPWEYQSGYMSTTLNEPHGCKNKKNSEQFPYLCAKFGKKDLSSKKKSKM